MGQPHFSGPIEIEPGWIDHNGHLNMAYYAVIFDRAGDVFFREAGMGPDYAKTGFTTYSAQFQIRYLSELHLGDRIEVHSWILGHDAKRAHSWQEIHRADGTIAATGEGMTLHIDRSGPRVAPMPPEIATRFDAFAARYAPETWPEGAGQGISLTRR